MPEGAGADRLRIFVEEFALSREVNVEVVSLPPIAFDDRFLGLSAARPDYSQVSIRGLIPDGSEMIGYEDGVAVGRPVVASAFYSADSVFRSGGSGSLDVEVRGGVVRRTVVVVEGSLVLFKGSSPSLGPQVTVLPPNVDHDEYIAPTWIPLSQSLRATRPPYDLVVLDRPMFKSSRRNSG